MLEEKDIQAIAQIMDTKIKESEERMQGRMQGMIRESESRMMTYFDAAVMPKFDLLADGQKNLLATLAPKSRVEAVEEDISLLKQVIRSMTKEIAELKKAQ